MREENDGRVLARVGFRSVADLCGSALLGRDCAYRGTEDGFELRMEIPPGWLPQPSPGASATIRIRSEGRVTGHDADGPLERGNVLVWTRSLDRLAREGLGIRIRTDRTSVLRTTVRTVVRSALIAFGILGAFLLLVIAEGRRRLARQRAGPGRPAQKNRSE